MYIYIYLYSNSLLTPISVIFFSMEQTDLYKHIYAHFVNAGCCRISLWNKSVWKKKYIYIANTYIATFCQHGFMSYFFIDQTDLKNNIQQHFVNTGFCHISLWSKPISKKKQQRFVNTCIQPHCVNSCFCHIYLWSEPTKQYIATFC